MTEQEAEAQKRHDRASLVTGQRLGPEPDREQEAEARRLADWPEGALEEAIERTKANDAYPEDASVILDALAKAERELREVLEEGERDLRAAKHLASVQMHRAIAAEAREADLFGQIGRLEVDLAKAEQERIIEAGNAQRWYVATHKAEARARELREALLTHCPNCGFRLRGEALQATQEDGAA